MIYEISNPSDAYTMESEREDAACVAALFLGEGKYGLTNDKDESVLPFFMFGGDPDKWLKDTHGSTIKELMAARGAEVVAALRSVTIGSRTALEEFKSAIRHMTPEAAEKFKAERHDKRRSSMNNIGKRAESLADAIEAKAKAEGNTEPAFVGQLRASVEALSEKTGKGGKT